MTDKLATSGIWVVTGAAGFIGSNACGYLLDQGQHVIGVDNFFSGTRENVDRLAAQGREAFKFFDDDVRDTRRIREIVSKAKVVVHLAAQVSVPRSFEDTEETNSININGFNNVLQAALDANVESFIYASSSAVYGDTSAIPIPETAPTSPLSPYGASKLSNETCAAALSHGHHLRTTGLRFFNIFGPWQDRQNGHAAVIPKWLDAMLNGHRPVLFGDGSAIRDFCYVDDVSRLLYLIGTRGPEPMSPIYNVATGVSTRMDRLFDILLCAVRDAGVDVVFSSPEKTTARKGDIARSLGDVSLLENELRYSTQTSLNEGITRILSDEFGLS